MCVDCCHGFALCSISMVTLQGIVCRLCLECPEGLVKWLQCTFAGGADATCCALCKGAELAGTLGLAV